MREGEYPGSLEADRLARSMKQLIETVEDFERKGIGRGGAVNAISPYPTCQKRKLGRGSGFLRRLLPHASPSRLGWGSS